MAQSPVLAFVFRPGGIQKDNVYTDFVKLVDDMRKVDGRKILEFDDSLTIALPERGCSITAAPPNKYPGDAYPMDDVVWAGFAPNENGPRAIVRIKEGAKFANLRMIGGQITVDNQAVSTSPISDFRDGPTNAGKNHVQIGLRDDCGNPQLFNSGDAPMFDLGDAGSQGRTVMFFAQNALLGIRLAAAQGVDPKPLIRQGANVDLTINFIGQNQTGNGLIESTGTRRARLGALSSATQIGAKNINEDGHQFAPVTRIQRKVQPHPPNPPATSHLQPTNPTPPAGELGQIGLPNLLLRCDGRGTDGSGFTVNLPKIAGGFFFSMQDRTALYTGGQEIIVAEISGGDNLRVQAFQGLPEPDTIDGSTAAVMLEGKQARTFASDGLNNWITIVGD
jgi:hypothetical protein